jgi:hypothetical protein
MEGIGFSEIIQYFFQFGPFAILPYLMLFALPRLYKQMKTASGDLKKILKRSIFLYQMLVVALVVFCVGFWTFSPGGTVYYYGEIKNLNSARDQLESPHLYFKDHLIDSTYIVKWIWKKQKDDNYADITLISEYSKDEPPIVKKFKFHVNELKRGRKALIEYNEDDGVLMHDPDNGGKLKRLTPAMGGNQFPAKRLKRPINSGPFVPLLYAAPQVKRLDPDKILENMQAHTYGIREQTVELVVQMADKDREGVKKILQQGFELLQGKTPGAAVQQRRLYNRQHLLTSLLIALDRLTEKWGTNHSHWEEILGTKTFDLIVEETNSRNSYIQRLARAFLSKIKKRVPQVVAGKGLESILKKSAPIDTLKKRPEVSPPISIKVNVKTDIVPKDLSGKKKQVVAMAMALKKRNIPFGWGGKNPEKGLDSSGFIAYIFHQAGLLEKPETWWSGKLRKEMGTPRKTKTPEQVGDLLFYSGGYVMLYLGNNKIIGMTPGGIIAQDYREFSLKLIQVNRVDYD